MKQYVCPLSTMGFIPFNLENATYKIYFITSYSFHQALQKACLLFSTEYCLPQNVKKHSLDCIVHFGVVYFVHFTHTIYFMKGPGNRTPNYKHFPEIRLQILVKTENIFLFCVCYIWIHICGAFLSTIF
jgi:hypothetical protein